VTLTAAALWFRGAGGALLRFDAHDAVPIDLFGATHGTIVTLHGLGEHLGKYDLWAAHAARRGFNVMLYDQRGHGRTPGRRGNYRFDALVEDLDRFVSVTADRYPGSPIFLLGHSLGALVVLRYAAGDIHPAVRGTILSGPPIVISSRVPEWYRWTVRTLARVAPWFPLRRRTAVHTRDAQRAATFARDPLGHRNVTARALVDTAHAIEAVRGAPEMVRLPLLVLLGDADTVVDVTQTIAFFEKVGSTDVTVGRHPGALHEMLQETVRDLVYDIVCSWCEKRVVTAATGRT